MQLLLHVAAVAISLAASQGHKQVRAPMPKPQDVPLIEGTYTLNYTVVMQGGGLGGPPGGPALVPRIILRSSTASITKSEITLGGWSGGGGGGWGGGGFDPDSEEFFEGRAARNAPAMSYTIDPTKTPMTIDVTTINARHKKEKALGLIEVNEDRITMAVAKPGAERPKNFDESVEVTLYYLKKVKPAPLARDEYRIVAMTIGKEADAEKELNKLAQEGFVLVNTTNPAANDSKSAPTTVHFVLKRTTRKP